MLQKTSLQRRVFSLVLLNNLSEEELKRDDERIKKILKESIIKMFNQGNFTFEEIDKGYFRKHIQR